MESLLVRASDTGIYWFLSPAGELVPARMRDPAALLAHMSPQCDARFAVTSATDDLCCDELVDRDPIPSWGKGVVTLLGGAAHPVLPAAFSTTSTSIANPEFRPSVRSFLAGAPP